MSNTTASLAERHPSRVAHNTFGMLADHISGLIFRPLPAPSHRRSVSSFAAPFSFGL